MVVEHNTCPFLEEYIMVRNMLCPVGGKAKSAPKKNKKKKNQKKNKKKRNNNVCISCEET